MPKTLTNAPMTMDQIHGLQPGDKFTLEYEVVRADSVAVNVRPVASSVTVNSFFLKKTIQDRNGTLTFKAPFVPKPGERFAWGHNQDFTLVWMDDKSIVYDETKTGERVSGSLLNKDFKRVS